MSQDEIDRAKQFVEAEFVLMDICDWLESQETRSVDVIFALNILEHLEKDKLVRVLEAVYRCLRPGGRLVAMVPNATSPFGSMTRYWDFTHHNAFTPSSVRQISRLVGFGESAEFRECGPVPYAFVSSIRFVLWSFIRCLIAGYLLVELADRKGGIYTADMLFRLTKPPA
jgi:SAM-dependent methyltransferase